MAKSKKPAHPDFPRGSEQRKLFQDLKGINSRLVEKILESYQLDSNGLHTVNSVDDFLYDTKNWGNVPDAFFPQKLQDAVSGALSDTVLKDWVDVRSHQFVHLLNVQSARMQLRNYHKLQSAMDQIVDDFDKIIELRKDDPEGFEDYKKKLPTPLRPIVDKFGYGGDTNVDNTTNITEINETLQVIQQNIVDALVVKIREEPNLLGVSEELKRLAQSVDSLQGDEVKTPIFVSGEESSTEVLESYLGKNSEVMKILKEINETSCLTLKDLAPSVKDLSQLAYEQHQAIAKNAGGTSYPIVPASGNDYDGEKGESCTPTDSSEDLPEPEKSMKTIGDVVNEVPEVDRETEASEVYPSDDEDMIALYVDAQYLFEQGDFDATVGFLHEIDPEKFNSGLLSLEKGKAFYGRGEIDNAVLCFDMAIRSEDSLPEVSAEAQNYIGDLAKLTGVNE